LDGLIQFAFTAIFILL